jgi:arylsulfatase A-like enzyme
MDTHMPYVGRKGYYPESWDSSYHGQITNPFKDYKTARNGPGLSEKDEEQIHALYDAEIQFADEYIGKILESLKRTGLEDKILLIFASDHGEELWDHGGKSEQDVRDFNWGFGHGHTLYEELILVPLIIRYPVALGQPGEMTTVNQQIRQVDFLPTILDLLEIRHEAAKHFEGETILDLLRGESSKSPAVFSESLLYGDEKKSIRTGGYKLVFNAASGETELYDLINDPGEEINIVDSQSERAQSLKETLIQWMQRMPPSVLTVH